MLRLLPTSGRYMPLMYVRPRTYTLECRSVGCTVIELLEGKPPYHFLDPMPALFRIVQDDSPPIPEGASPIVKDFLYHCFQKDCNLRISAKKLLRHPWMVAARKQLAAQQGGKASEGPTDAPARRPVSNYNYDEAVLKVQEWNEALKCKCQYPVLFCPGTQLTTVKRPPGPRSTRSATARRPQQDAQGLHCPRQRT